MRVHYRAEDLGIGVDKAAGLVTRRTYIWSVMPNEQAHFGERVPHGTSKNAKNKRNSATLQASLLGTHRDLESRATGVNARMSHCDSEKDSGYSEAGSDIQNDQDDQRSSVTEPHWANTNSSSVGHNLTLLEERNPICIINNLLVKPSGPEQLLHTPLVWGETWHNRSGSKPPTQVLLIQQPGGPSPIPSLSNLPDLQIQCIKEGSKINKPHTGKNSYLPILNSFPRIAPHPKKEGPERGKVDTLGSKESSGEGQSLSKRVCTENKREAVSTTAHHRHHHRQHESRTHSHSIYKAGSSQSSSPHLPHHSMGGPTSSKQPRSHRSWQHAEKSPPQPIRVGYSGVTSSSLSSSSSPSCTDGWASGASADLSDCLSDGSSVRQRRFFKTAEILSQSGLLAITLRTKELLRQNAASEKELAQLRQHAQLLCLAAQATHPGQEAPWLGCGTSPSPLDKLLQAMSESGSYPSLDWTHFKFNGQDRVRADKDKYKNRVTKDSRLPQNNLPMPLVYGDDDTSPPSPLFAQSPDIEERPNILASLLSNSPPSPETRRQPV
ncbi:hypothetical protein UPYG_G00114640 [Umbra pygmaea]|uniref:CLOCK-interacting pacemaker-like n=1 Tax=Umbra pygmaea TaxID=75934 RepID=A0ABD0X3G1_UMBPY